MVSLLIHFHFEYCYIKKGFVSPLFSPTCYTPWSVFQDGMIKIYIDKYHSQISSSFFHIHELILIIWHLLRDIWRQHKYIYDVHCSFLWLFFPPLCLLIFIMNCMVTDKFTLSSLHNYHFYQLPSTHFVIIVWFFSHLFICSLLINFTFWCLTLFSEFYFNFPSQYLFTIGLTALFSVRCHLPPIFDFIQQSQAVLLLKAISFWKQDQNIITRLSLSMVLLSNKLHHTLSNKCFLLWLPPQITSHHTEKMCWF